MRLAPLAEAEYPLRLDTGKAIMNKENKDMIIEEPGPCGSCAAARYNAPIGSRTSRALGALHSRTRRDDCAGRAPRQIVAVP